MGDNTLATGVFGQDANTSGASSKGDVFGLVGQRLDGKYDIESVVAEGGFGVVYRGTHIGLNKSVAVKVLKVPTDTTEGFRKEFLAKFTLEARTVAQLEHPAIVRVIDFGGCLMPVGGAAPWMALEWLSGTSLEHDLKSRGGAPRTPPEALALLQPVFEALALAHEASVAHRDIKPANLMLVPTRDGKILLKVLDFGIAKLMDSEERTLSGQTATRSSMRAFSPQAAAPEQLSGTRTGPWTDVHGLGLIVSEVITGCVPYPSTDANETFAAVMMLQRPTPAKHGFDAGVWEPVLARALALRPADRYSDARAFFMALAASVPQTVTRWGAGSPLSLPFARGDLSQNSTLRPSSQIVSEHGSSARIYSKILSPKGVAGIGIAVVAFGVLVGVGGEFTLHHHEAALGGAIIEGTGVHTAATMPEANETVLDPDLDAQIARGMAFRLQGRNELALDEFRQAYQRSHRPIARAQMALAAQALGRWIDAARDIRGALASDQDPAVRQNRPAFEASYRAIVQHLALIEVRSGAPGAEVWVNGDRIGSLPLDDSLYLLPGSVTLEVRAPGYLTSNREVTVREGESRVELIELAPASPR